MILAIIQARMSSGRLKNKVLKKIENKEILKIIYQKIEGIKEIDNVLIATSNHKSDNAIESFCIKNNFRLFRGSLNNVLDRFYKASLTSMPDHILRITADCPLIDSEVVKKIIKLHLKYKNNYTSNTIVPFFPDGMDAEIFDFNSLSKTFKLAKKNMRKNM